MRCIIPNRKFQSMRLKANVRSVSTVKISRPMCGSIMPRSSIIHKNSFTTKSNSLLRPSQFCQKKVSRQPQLLCTVAPVVRSPMPRNSLLSSINGSKKLSSRSLSMINLQNNLISQPFKNIAKPIFSTSPLARTQNMNPWTSSGGAVRCTRGNAKMLRENLLDVLSGGTRYTKDIVTNMDDNGWVEVDLIYKLYPRIAQYAKEAPLEPSVKAQTTRIPTRILELSEDQKKIRVQENSIKDRVDNELRDELGWKKNPSAYPPAVLHLLRTSVKAVHRQPLQGKE